jgi:MFS family permease
MISLGHGAALLVVSSSMAHLALYLTEDRGYSAARAALVAGIVPLFQILGTALGGVLGDRMNKRLIAGIAMLMHGAALIVLVWIEHVAAVGAFVVLHGVAWGVRGPQMQAIRADYFGSTAFASIMGWSQIIVTMGSIAGPVLAGVLADSTGDYRLGFTVLGIAAAFGVVFWVLAAPPTPHGDRATIA